MACHGLRRLGASNDHFVRLWEMRGRATSFRATPAISSIAHAASSALRAIRPGRAAFGGGGHQLRDRRGLQHPASGQLRSRAIALQRHLRVDRKRPHALRRLRPSLCHRRVVRGWRLQLRTQPDRLRRIMQRFECRRCELRLVRQCLQQRARVLARTMQHHLRSNAHTLRDELRRHQYRCESLRRLQCGLPGRRALRRRKLQLRSG